jgi:hypothetical protein
VSQALADDEGYVHLLDQQLCQVLVFSPDGDLLRTLGREGDGPGEFRMPWDLALLPEQRVGVAMTMPGTIVVLEASGEPHGTIPIGGTDPVDGGLHVLDQVQCRGGHLAVVGRTVRQTADGLERTRFLSMLDFDGNETARLIEETAPDAMLTGRYVERDDYFVNLGRWALAPDGTVYAAVERDRYVVQVQAPDGRILQVIERKHTPWRRTAEEKAQVGDGLIAIVDGERVQLEVEAEDHAPCISRLHVTGDGELFVLPMRGMREQPTGIMQTFDVFDRSGRFDRQVAVACDDCEVGRDRLHLIGGERVLVVRNHAGSVRGMTGTEGTEENGGAVEVVCYRIEREEPAAQR